MDPIPRDSPAQPLRKPQCHPPQPHSVLPHIYPSLNIPSMPEFTYQTPEIAKKKRGRPRKYSPEGGEMAMVATETPVKKKGRPPGSGKKQIDNIGSFGASFTPHVIMVNAGEDIASKILAFSQQGMRTVCVLSANGAVSNVTLRQPSISGGTMTYKGRYEIISLSGSYLILENNGSRSRTGGLSVSMTDPDGNVLGGGIAGELRAAVPVQVIVGSFIANCKKPKPGPSSAPPGIMLNFGEPQALASPSSQPHSSESEEDNGNPTFNGGPVFYNDNNNHHHHHHRNNNNNNNVVSQAFHGMPVHSNMLWQNPTSHNMLQQ